MYTQAGRRIYKTNCVMGLQVDLCLGLHIVAVKTQFRILNPNLRSVCSGFQVFGIHETYLTKSMNQVEEVLVHPKNSIEVLRKWGCSDTEVSKLFVEKPSLGKANITRFLSCRINHCFDERLEFFWTLFMSRDVLSKDILRSQEPFTLDI